MIYLASPYSHKDPGIREARYHAALQCVAFYTQNDTVVFSPIVHNHPIAVLFMMPGDWGFWRKFDTEFISRCDELWILMIDGWRESKGISAEILIADEYKKPVKFIRPTDDGYELAV